MPASPSAEGSIVWFRQDLRLQDQPAFSEAVKRGGPVIPVYIWSPAEEGAWPPGGAQRWWLHRALEILDGDLRKRGLRLTLRTGPAEEVLRALVRETGAGAVYWNRRYEPAAIARDTELKRQLSDEGIEVSSFNGSLLFEPWTVSTGQGKSYKVYTPFWKNVSAREVARPLEDLPGDLSGAAPGTWPESVELEALGLLPKINWYESMERCWTPSETSAHQRLQAFLDGAVRNYDDARDFPACDGTSTLSPYLHFGHISPRQVWWAAVSGGHRRGRGGEVFLKELVWREFAYHVLYHYPDTPERPLRAEFGRFPWQDDTRVDLERWQQGQTGYPLVDAGMRQLYRDGWMHNRVRMVVASFLVKHLLVPWQDGARWFWDTLVDADLASNTLGWQWAGGCGADAAPYFRIFNPMTQSEKFDADGAYIREYVPELKELSAPHIHQPWEAPAHVLEAAGIRLGEDYPEPMVDHKSSRERALAAYAEITGGKG